MSIFYFNSPPSKDIVDFDEITRMISKSDRNSYFLSDWDSGSSINYLNLMYKKAFKESRYNIDHYNSSEKNECQSTIVNYINKLYNMSLSENQVIIGNSATSLISFYILQLTSLGIKNYLGLSPIYYTFLDAIKIVDANITIYQPTLIGDFIDNDEVENVIKEKKIEAIIITDPIFCFGISIKKSVIENLIRLAKKYNCYIISDFTREGIRWCNDFEDEIIGDSIKMFDGLNKFAILYSPCKKVFANGIKTGILIISNENIDYVYSLQDSFIGSISSMQIKFLSLLFKEDNYGYIYNQIAKNKELIMSNYQKIMSLFSDSGFELARPQLGNFTVAKVNKLGNSDKEFFYFLVNKFNVITLPLSLYHYYDKNNYLFRINLTLKKDDLINAIIRLLKL